MSHFYSDATIPDLYRWFSGEVRDSSPVWESVCLWVADTPTVADLLDGLPGMKRQPNLFLAALRFLQAPLQPGPQLHHWVEQHWHELREVIVSRTTQTNEPGRCASLLPLLNALDQPIALVEVGSSAGLCLYPDRYRYRYYDDHHSVEIGDNPAAPMLECRVRSGPLPDPVVPKVAARIGLDLNPLDPTDPDTARWLHSLIWPGQPQREQQLADAITVAATSPPVTTVTGDVLSLDDALALVPDGTTPVVMHSAVLAYVDRQRRQDFVDLVTSRKIPWIANEAVRVIPGMKQKVPASLDTTGSFILAVDGEPVARTAPHGQWIEWF